jgi:hypothetical protein
MCGRSWQRPIQAVITSPCLLDGLELVAPTQRSLSLPIQLSIQQATQMEVASASGGSGAVAQGTRTGASLSDVTV